MTTQDHSGTHATLADSGDNTNSQELPRGSNLGRYVIIEPIGSGGMGTVYRAYDPQLNRGVALKILSVKQEDIQAAERAKARLIREAQALAQLSHPNVVAVHDAGTFEDDVFIAMELVEGKTLGDWLKEEKRAVREILEVMIAAGKGLSAAHKSGLVHRDFKPGNVMVGDDGRVRVLDFGLARGVYQQALIEDELIVSEKERQSHESNDSFGYREISSDSSPNLLQSPLTNAGGVLGTPLYMAPEQHLGLKTDERTDQFGFCVVLYEALYGRRPFLAATMEKLKREVIRQQVRHPSTDTDVPAWLWKIIYKGLSVKPEDRYSNIDELLEELDEDPEEIRRKKLFELRRKSILFFLIVLTITLPVGVWYGLRYRTFQLCKVADIDFDGVWDEATKVSIRKAFLSTEKSFALGTWERVVKIFDSYKTKWVQMRSDVCEARLIRGTESEELFDLRMSCLRRRARELRALVRVFVEANSQVVQKAVQASSSMAGIAICANEEALRAPYPPPKTADAKRKVAEIREQLSYVEALSKTGKYFEGLTLAKKLDEEANAIAYQPIQAEVLFWLGRLYDKTGDYKRAETSFNNAILASGKSKNALLTAKAMVWLVRIVGHLQARYEAGLSTAQAAEAVLELSGDNDEIRSSLFSNMGTLFFSKGDYNKALSFFQKSLVIREKFLGSEHSLVAHSLNNIGIVFTTQEDYSKSLDYFLKSLKILKKTLGYNHPKIAHSLNNLGVVYWNLGKPDRALEYYRNSLEIREKALGPEHPLVATTLSNMGFVYRKEGKYEKAQECLHKARNIWEKTLGHEHPDVAATLSGIGNVYVDQGRSKNAIEPLERAESICEKKTCEPETHGQGLFGLAQALFSTNGDGNRAIKLAKQAREIFEKTPKRFKKELAELTAWLQNTERRNSQKRATNDNSR